MSWTFTVPKTPKSAFNGAVDAAELGGSQEPTTPGLAEDVAVAKAAMKALATRVKRPFVNGSANGHCLQPEEGESWHDGIWVSVGGQT